MVTSSSREKALEFKSLKITPTSRNLSQPLKADLGIKLGHSGCIECLKTGVFTLLGWPCPPLLCLYTLSQRSYLRKIYRETDIVAPTTCSDTIADVSTTCFCWPLVILQHVLYLNRKKEEGLLRFDWETEVLQDMKAPVFPIKNKLVMILGPSGVGKSLLFRKLLGEVTDKTDVTNRDASKIQIGKHLGDACEML
jgi:ABC-type uncharacterized transport system fused permease/ATPase subunit